MMDADWEVGVSGTGYLIDPLAALMKPALAPFPPLLLSATDVLLQVRPDMAVLSLTRQFTNAEDIPIEAVLTMPPALDGEVVYGVAVTIGEATWDGIARSRRKGELSYDAAAVDGRRAILIEEVGRGWRTLSIAGILPREGVSVRIDSVIGVQAGKNTLRLCPGDDPERSVPPMADHISPRQTNVQHRMELKIEVTDGIDVLVDGQATDKCASAALTGEPLLIAVDIPAGIALPPLDPRHALAAKALTAKRDMDRISAGTDPAGQDAGRRLALAGNLLTNETSLVFIGPDGEASAILPPMRKIALVAAEPRVMPVPPPVDVPAAGDHPDLQPPDIAPTKPGGRRGISLRLPRAPQPLSVRLGNWLRHQFVRGSHKADAAALGRQVVDLVPTVAWRHDGALALRSGDAAHLPRAAQDVLREVAACRAVRHTAAALRLTPEHVAIVLLAVAAAPTVQIAADGLSNLFPGERSRMLPAVLRSLSTRFEIPV